MAAKTSKARAKKHETPPSSPVKMALPVRNGGTIAGFGASAGGLEAFSEVLAHIPADTGMALIFVQHLDPKHASVLTELLARSTSMPVSEIKDHIPAEPNRVYVIPPNTNLSISRGFLRLAPRPPSGPHMPIDGFFRSLAEENGSRAIGVILSGTASDGTLGLKSIKGEGGITFAQDPQSSKYDGMPRSAIAAGCVDFVLPPKAIAQELVRLCRHPYVAEIGPEAEPVSRENDYTEIFSLLRSATGVDFTFYKHATIHRRILRRMALNCVDTPETYVRLLRDNPDELRALFQDVLINVTGFFREPGTFEFLKTRVLPSLLRDRAQDDPIRVWVPGCATGEDAYSIGICVLEYTSDQGLNVPIQIFGTDLSEAALEKARAGIYPESIAADVSPERLRKFFSKTNGNYQIAHPVRDLCIFARQNLTRDPPFSKLDIITCRNVLIYLGPVLQQKVIRVFHYALKPSGYLVLGNSETVGTSDLFHTIDRKQRVFVPRGGMAPVPLDLVTYDQTRTEPAERKPPDAPASEIQRRIDQILLSRYSPPGVVVDSDLKIVQFRGRTAPYLEHSSGEANLNLVRMARGGLGLEIRKLVLKARARENTVHSGVLRVGHNDSVRSVRISVVPVKGLGDSEPQFIVLFEDLEQNVPAPRPTPSGKTPAAQPRRVRDLEQELASTKLYLQSVIEEQEATTEELKSANEEIQSSNEELQSTNEELLTAKEELQSTNEELTTVNEEMQGRNVELSQTNNDLQNLLSSVNIAIVMLGNDLRIRRFTPQAEKVLNLRPTDVGRPINDLRPNINVPDLQSLFLDVIDNLTVREREVQDKEGRAYSMWIRPYRTSDNKIDGVVMSLFDVTERKHAAGVRYRRLFEAAREGILVVDAGSGEILDANPFLCALLSYPLDGLAGRRLSDTGIFGALDLRNMVSGLAASEAWHRAAVMHSRTGQSVEVDVVGNIYREDERRVLQLNIRDGAGRTRGESGQTPIEEGGRDAQKLQIVGRLAGGLARDFNNSLTTIIGFAGRLQERLGTSSAAAAEVQEIKRAGERAAELTRQLLAFGRSHSAQVQILDLNSVVSGIEQMMRIMLPGNVELQVHSAAEPVTARVDRFQTEQIILEMIVNARDAMPAGGSVTVGTSNESVDAEFSRLHPAVPPGQYAVLRVSDTGAGVEADRRLPAYRSFMPDPAGGMAGFEGLEAAIRAANGYVWSYLESGKGSTMAVYLPRASGKEETPAETPRGSEIVLLVECEHPIRVLAAGVLRDHGYTVFEASSGLEALRGLKQEARPVQLLITEVLMPKMSGPELAHRLASQQPDAKVLYLSGDTDHAIADFGVLEPGVALLRKPFTPVELARKVREALDGG